ncbi:MAG: flagellar motor protein [Sphingomonas sanxanigenens]|uniref:Flagellar motor protein n=1 Tax=Sphingomonas sanxanigenens TaxID=397260 RepID=A0A2W5CAF7_9SPHN|nr:MAG: flagellar motor protein [Sphingomonas sanxanigenens]
MASKAKPGSNEPPKIIVVKKIVSDEHDGHHGGAWKVAYADFVTAMMAFFLLMWLLGATTEKQRKALADYFSPTLVEFKQNSAGSNGLLGGSSLVDADNYPHKAAQTGSRQLTVPLSAVGGIDVGTGSSGSLKTQEEDRAAFNKLAKALRATMTSRPDFRQIAKNVTFTQTREGLRIDLIDDADFSMFALSTTALEPRAASLIDQIAEMVKPMSNHLTIRGHTDSVPYGNPAAMNNWMLSSGRAEATRRRLHNAGVPDIRFERIEGVADREPYVPKDANDPRNRRVSITLLYRRFG